ncbi:MAG: efflux RND transporter permease subunit [Alphaproteobacteria bacterium]|nr:efflux RND transporter permease subunit [Alphaproteobacteria bacterium]
MTRRLVRLGIDHPVLLNLLFLVVCVAGVVAWLRLPKEEFPQVGTDRVIVAAAWPGASPAELEDAVLRPLEDALDGIEGLRHVDAEATEGRATLTLDLLRTADPVQVADEVRTAVDDVATLPDDVVGPTVAVAEVELALAHVGLTGDPRRRDVAEALADQLLELPFVASVALEGAWERTIEVELDPAAAAARGLGPVDVARALEAAAQGAPAGTLTRAGEGVLVRTVKGVRAPADLAGVPLRVADGAELTVGQVAHIAERWRAPELGVRVDGQPAILLVVRRTSDADALAAVPALQAWAEEAAAGLPPGLQLRLHDDSAYVVRDRLQVLGSSGAVGLVLVALVLGAFVGRRNAALVVWGMPVAYLGAIAALYAVGQSMNLISMFGLLLVTGILVDDAVVIVENVQRHLEQGRDRVTATVEGTLEVLPAVVAATLTTCLSFAPLLLLEGLIGRVMRIVPIVVILSLIASLFEAFVILPGHLAHHAQETEAGHDNAPTRWLRAAYTPLLRTVTLPRWRAATLVGVLLVVLGAGGLLGVMRLTLTSPGHPVLAIVQVRLPPSSHREATTQVVAAAEALAARPEHAPLLRFLRAELGRLGKPDTLPLFGDRYAQLVVGFRNDKALATRTWAFVDDLEAELERQPEVMDVEVEVITGSPPVGRPVDVRVRGREPEEVDAVARALVAHLEGRDGVHGVRTDQGQGNDALEVRVDPARAARLGLREQEIALATRAAIDGTEALELALDGRSVPVRVSARPPQDRAGVEDLVLPLPAPAPPTRIRQVADVRRDQGVERITRVDGERSVRLTAELTPSVTTSADEQAAVEEAFAALAVDHPGVRLLWGGEAADTAESFGRLPQVGLLALTLIYAVLAVQFRSYLQPLIILSAVPLGFVGAVLGLLAFGMDLTLVAMVGVVGLTGIVVNDSLVLVDFVNQRRREGAEVLDAVQDASLQRLRPILITTVTTIAGLLPLALGLTGEEPLLAPMAVAIAAGLAVATALTLVVVPVLYLALDDLTRWTRRGKPAGS